MPLMPNQEAIRLLDTFNSDVVHFNAGAQRVFNYQGNALSDQPIRDLAYNLINLGEATHGDIRNILKILPIKVSALAYTQDAGVWTATATTPRPHYYKTGDAVTMVSCTPEEANNTFAVTVPSSSDPTTFSFTFAPAVGPAAQDPSKIITAQYVPPLIPPHL